MAEETLFCPSCNQKVRVPEEMLGQPVQCPLCRLVFTAPVRGGAPPQPPMVTSPVQPPSTWPAPPPGGPPQFPVQPGYPAPPGYGYPQTQPGMASLRAAGIALLIVGVLEFLVDLVLRVGQTYAAGPDGLTKQMEEMSRIMPGLMDQKGGQMLTPQGMYLLTMGMALFWTACSLGMIVGGIQMLRARSYGLALMGSVLGMLTFIDFPCCCLSVGISLWALITLFRPDVRNLFA